MKLVLFLRRLSAWKTSLLAAAALVAAFGCVTTQSEKGFVSLFDGKTLNGWTLLGKKGDGYGVKDGVIYCAKGGGGNLLTDRQFDDFILRFEFKLEPGSNNGIGIRTPFEGATLAYTGMEIQVLDTAYDKPLKPAQYHGSVYDIVPAKTGALKPAGEWNTEEILAQGRRIKVTVNGKVIVDTDLNQVADAATLRKHPGMLREKGHLGFLGHNDYCEFRNIRIKELPKANANNVAPAGFKKLFNGRDLEGWKGLVADPVKRAKIPPMDLALAQLKADTEMVRHWRVEDGTLVFDGKGKSLCTAKDYADFEMLVDWKILPDGDSGIYLRGSPQIQIWDPWGKNEKAKVGSGGVFNNQVHPAAPTKLADHYIGDWNRFRILMVGEKVHVFLNGELVVNNVTMENYWDRAQPIFPTGQLELQNHGNTLWFRNIYVREINTSSPIASAPPPPQPPKAAPAAKGKKAAPKAAPKKQ